MGPEVLTERRRQAEAARLHHALVQRYRLLYQAIDPTHPLSLATALALLPELAGAEAGGRGSANELYETAAATWHPDLPGGDGQVFELLREAYRVVTCAPHEPG
ncbi:hypothetical protein [Kitasatospora sp. LaBMicrA B282]|uniref:hypothetical protein n=1 Tax=Kitasatospora sp. LaBMicrA B282 TaxID=3420949 RepID=UPI003D0CB8FA